MDSIDNVISPIKPILQSVTRTLPGPIDNFAASLLGAKCHKSLLRDIDFSSSNLACFQLAISKALGVAIIAASAIVKLPQLVKLLQSQSAAGLSFLSYLLETASFTITLAYGVRRGFPFSTFGETALVALQNVAIAFFILVFSGKATWCGAFLVGFGSIASILFSRKMIPMDTLTYLQAGAGVLSAVSKLPQIYAIWREGGTGQLSAFAVFNYLAGSLARIFTTVQEVDDKLILYGYLAGFTLNAIIAAQMIYYWSGTTATPTLSKSDFKKPIAVESSTSTTSSSELPAKSRASTTKRRG